MTLKPPPTPGASEALEELEADALVSARAVSHEPTPRAVVREERRSVVVDGEAEARPPRELAAYTTDRAAKTVVVSRARSRRLQASARGRSSSWRGWLIWGSAGLGAFALGGAFSLLSRSKAPEAPATAEPTLPPGLAASPPAPAPVASLPPAEPAVAPPAPSEERVASPEDLPRGTEEDPTPAVQAPRPSTKPRPSVAASPAKSPKPRPLSDIPDGI